jgi:hypothetical protein
VNFSFDIDNEARFAANNGSGFEAIREKLFGKQPSRPGLRIKPAPAELKIAPEGGHRSKLLRRPLKAASRLVKSGIAAERQEEPNQASELIRKRMPVEYLGYQIINEQQADSKWVATFFRNGEEAECAQRSGAHPASYMAFSDAKRQIDALLQEPANNRKYQRVLVALQGAIFVGSNVQECQILDLSPGGARVKRDNPIPLEGEIHLYIKGFGRFKAEVIRGKELEVAMRFTCDSDAVMGLLKGLSNYVKGYETSQTKERREVRVPTSIAAVCRMPDGTAVPCEIIDASMRSMSLRIAERPRIGATVILGKTKMRVVRHHSHGFAVQSIPLPPAKVSRFAIKDEE